MPKSSEPQPDRSNARARALLEAAEAILAESGYDGLSARAVADRAGVNKGLVFYYWKNTAGLFEEVLSRYYERHKEVLSTTSTSTDMRARTHELIDVYLDFMENNVTYARIVQQQVSSGGAHLPLVKRHLTEVLSIATEAFGDRAEMTGHLAPRHFQLTLSAAVINYFTYAPILGKDFWDSDPMSAPALAERRAHIHWIVDAWLDALG
jgi:AcrR family transcriptional regulator